MTLVLRIVLGTGAALGILWTIAAAMAHGPGGLAVVGLFFIVYALYSVMLLFAAWVYWQHPAERSLAGWIMALPFVFWFSPMLIRSLSGGVMTQQQLVSMALLLLAVALATCWFFPRKVATLVPDILVSSKLFNSLILIGMIGGWLFMIFVVLYVANTPASGPADTDSGMALAYAAVLAALYVIGLGVASFGASTWAWLSLRGGFECTTRKLNIAQLVVAAPGIMLGVVVAVWMAGQSHL